MTLNFQTDLLAKVPFLADLDPEAVRLLAFAGDKMPFERGSIIFEAGQKSDGGHLVLQGQVDLYRSRRFDAPVRSVRAGGLIGEVALITPTERPVWAVAATDCVTLRITRGALWRVLNEFPHDAEILRSSLLARVRSLLGELALQHSGEHPSII